MKPLALRILGRGAVLQVGGADFLAAIDDVTEALAALRAGTAETPPEISVTLGTPPHPHARAYILPARVGAYAGVKWTAHRPIDADAEPGALPGVVSMTLFNDAATGRPLALVESALLTAMRTAAVSALALRHAAPRPVRRITLLGAGTQSRAHLRMLAAIFPDLDMVTLCNRTTERPRTMATVIAAPWPLRVSHAVDDAIAGADAVLACTAAREPFLRPEHLAPGRLIVQVGHHEASFAAIERADCVLVDLWGEFRLTSAKSLFQMHRTGRFEAARIAADLGAIVLDSWRPTPDAAVYMSCFGLNVFDIALAGRVLRAAEAEGLGWLLPLSDPEGSWDEGIRNSAGSLA